MNRLLQLERGGTLKLVKGKCRVCLETLPKRRRGYCSDEHRDAYYLATSGEFLRFKVFERDKGVCAECHLDCDALEQRVFGFSTMVKRPRQRQYQDALLLPYELRTAKCAALIRVGFSHLTSNHPRTLWNADHIVPVTDVGGWGLDNLQTLCQPCHIAKTSDEARWRAKRRKVTGAKTMETTKRLKQLGVL